MVLADMGSSDVDQTQRVHVSVRPEHLTTNVAPDTTVRLSLVRNAIDAEKAKELVIGAASVVFASDKRAVDGEWLPVPYSDRVEFVPSKPLTEGEYLIKLASESWLVSEQSTHAFRVGSMPRIVSVNFLVPNNDPSTGVSGINILFSEFIDASFVGNTVTLGAGAQDIPFKVLTGGLGDTRTVAIETQSVLSAEQFYDLSVGPELGGGKTLDSNYTGTEASTPFALHFRLNDYASSGWKWEPDVKY
ncbi:MAG: hypothetical protein JRH20_20230 [Deltaproteobacteria bacterium]|nr:hypothetical protein [Deltaproteobacteria bacterium]